MITELRKELRLSNEEHRELLGPVNADDMIQRKRVRTRWPDDNNFYEAVITDYNPVEISREDIQWVSRGPWNFSSRRWRVFGGNHPDPVEIEKAKNVLKEQEQGLNARLADISDGEIGTSHSFLHHRD
ncbi:hypothetical protein Dsin_026771 [Dipteronia sinensis]|uniref:ENT domain-containing protein n=1 Tax=Dipteronia sinensis TaxID=43782 RepID=A0AAD9ZYH9_9ROSI|nr:hypothetical protein Dsin_026771 [Dipteronia sinensis]